MRWESKCSCEWVMKLSYIVEYKNSFVIFLKTSFTVIPYFMWKLSYYSDNMSMTV